MSSANPSDDKNLKFEAALVELETILHELEEGEVGLDESLARYEQGVRLLKHCHALLEKAERRIELCTGIDADGNPVTVPFDEQAASLEEKANARTQRRTKPAASSPKKAKEKEEEREEPGGLF